MQHIRSLEDARHEVEVHSLIGLHPSIVWCFMAQYQKYSSTFNIFLEFIPGALREKA